MKPGYSSLFSKKGAHVGGIVRVYVAPKEWLITDIEVDYETNKITQAITLIPLKEWIALQFTTPTYVYTEKPKTNKSGDYFEITIAGVLNNYNSISQQVLTTLRNHELVAVLTDRYKRQRIIGNKETGLSLQFSNALKNAPAGEEQVAADINMMNEFSSPFVDDGEYIILPTEEDILLYSDEDFLLYD